MIEHAWFILILLESPTFPMDWKNGKLWKTMKNRTALPWSPVKESRRTMVHDGTRTVLSQRPDRSERADTQHCTPDYTRECTLMQIGNENGLQHIMAPPGHPVKILYAKPWRGPCKTLWDMRLSTLDLFHLSKFFYHLVLSQQCSTAWDPSPWTANAVFCVRFAFQILPWLPLSPVSQGLELTWNRQISAGWRDVLKRNDPLQNCKLHLLGDCLFENVKSNIKIKKCKLHVGWSLYLCIWHHMAWYYYVLLCVVTAKLSDNLIWKMHPSDGISVHRCVPFRISNPNSPM